MENAWHCLVAVVAQGTKSWLETEERRARRPDTLSIPNHRASRGMRGTTKETPQDQNSYPVEDMLHNWKPMQFMIIDNSL